MSEQPSAPGISAETTSPTPVTETATDKFVKDAVAQVKEARSKEAKLRGMPDLAKVFAGQKPEKDKDADAAPAESAPAAPSAPASPAAPVVDPAEAAAAERKAKRQQELAELAKSGREKWVASQAEKQERSALAKAKADLEAERSRIKADKDALEAATKDPFKFLESRGVPPEELARQVLRRGDATAQVEDVRAELAALKKQQAEDLEARERAQREAQERAQRENQVAQQRASEREFISLTSDASKYPALNALYTPQEILIKAYHVVQAARAANPDRFYDDSEIADYLEKEASPRIQKLREPPVAQQQPAPKVPETPAATVGQTEQAQKSRTLTSSMTSEATVDQAAFKKLSRAKQNQILAERLKAHTDSKGRGK